MPRKKKHAPENSGEENASSSKRKKKKTSSVDSSPVRDDRSRYLRKKYHPLGYPIPPFKYASMTLENSFEECFGNLDGYSEEHARVKLVASRMSQSVVSLASFKGKRRLFACTGTIIEQMPSEMNILTSASFVTCHKYGAKMIKKLKIRVHLPNGKIVQGKLKNYDVHYNIAVVKTKPFPELCAVHIRNGLQFNFESSQTNLVAIGRCFKSGELMATTGTSLCKNSRLDCQELMMSTCKITKAGIGGPLVGFGGNFVGMNFYAKDETPFLPISILQKCLQHFEIFGEIVKPWHGLRIGSLQAEKLSILEEIHDKVHHADGVYVRTVSDRSPAAISGIKAGDLISNLDKIALSNAQEFHELIWDKTLGAAMGHGEGMVFEVSILRPSDGFEFSTTINTERMDVSQQNRWPVPEVEWKCLEKKSDDNDDEFMPDLIMSSRFPVPDLSIDYSGGIEPDLKFD